MEPDSAPVHTLPPIRSSTLQANVRKTARAVTRHATGVAGASSSKSPPPVRVEETTLGALAARLKGVDENAFDPGAYLRRAGVQAPKRTGAGLAGAALKKLGKR